MVVRRGDLLDVPSLGYQASVPPILSPTVASERLPDRRLHHNGHQYLIYHRQLDAGVHAMQTDGRHDPSGIISKRSVSQPICRHDGSNCAGMFSPEQALNIFLIVTAASRTPFQISSSLFFQSRQY